MKNDSFHPEDKDFKLAGWSFNRPNGDFNPLQVDFSTPTIELMSEKQKKGKEYPQRWVVIPEDVKEDEWVGFGSIP